MVLKYQRAGIPLFGLESMSPSESSYVKHFMKPVQELKLEKGM